MKIEDEIIYRDEILSRVRNGEKISSDERLWLATHRIINRSLGYPYLNTDIVHLHPNVDYAIRIKIEALAYPNRILPVITVPGGKGGIVPNTLLVDNQRIIPTNKSVKMLGLLIDLNHNETEVIYRSKLGLLGISFECDYYDDKQRILIRKNSGTGDPTFAMIRDVISKNKIVYRCKTPVTNGFDDFVFSIEGKIRDEKMDNGIFIDVPFP